MAAPSYNSPLGNGATWRAASATSRRASSTTVQDLAPAVAERAKQFLLAEKDADYRRHAKEMVTALYAPTLKNDGTGTITVVFQVPKEINVRAVRVRFRLPAAKLPPRLEILGAAYAPKQ